MCSFGRRTWRQSFRRHVSLKTVIGHKRQLQGGHTAKTMPLGSLLGNRDLWKGHTRNSKRKRWNENEARKVMGLPSLPMGQWMYTFNAFGVTRFLLETGEGMVALRQGRAKQICLNSHRVRGAGDLVNMRMQKKYGCGGSPGKLISWTRLKAEKI